MQDSDKPDSKQLAGSHGARNQTTKYRLLLRAEGVDISVNHIQKRLIPQKQWAGT